MDDYTVDQEFEKIAVNETLRIIDRDLGRGSTCAGAGANSALLFDKFLKPSSEPLPDIDTDYVGPWKGFLKDSESVDSES